MYLWVAQRLMAAQGGGEGMCVCVCRAGADAGHLGVNRRPKEAHSGDDEPVFAEARLVVAPVSGITPPHDVTRAWEQRRRVGESQGFRSGVGFGFEVRRAGLSHARCAAHAVKPLPRRRFSVEAREIEVRLLKPRYPSGRQALPRVPGSLRGAVSTRGLVPTGVPDPRNQCTSTGSSRS